MICPFCKNEIVSVGSTFPCEHHNGNKVFLSLEEVEGSFKFAQCCFYDNANYMTYGLYSRYYTGPRSNIIIVWKNIHKNSYIELAQFKPCKLEDFPKEIERIKKLMVFL